VMRYLRIQSMERLTAARNRQPSRAATPTWRHSPARGAATASNDIDQLQRSIGNRAVGQMLRSRSRPGNRLPVQRVGGKKIGFELDAPAGDLVVIEGQTLLLSEWQRITGEEHALKVSTERTKVESGATETIAYRAREKERADYLEKQRVDPLTYSAPVDTAYAQLARPITGKFGFSQLYFGQLRQRNRADQRKLLMARSGAFTSNNLRIEADGTIMYRTAKGVPHRRIGVLREGNAAYAVKTAQGTAANERDIYH